jgi:hypothetical protein
MDPAWALAWWFVRRLHYRSVACMHADHDECPVWCPFCGSLCKCKCHQRRRVPAQPEEDAMSYPDDTPDEPDVPDQPDEPDMPDEPDTDQPVSEQERPQRKQARPYA